MDTDQIKIAANALASIMETSGCDLNDMEENLSGTIYSHEEFSQIRNYLESI